MFPFVLFFSIATVALPKANDQVSVTVHEWGTFTSIAGEDGTAIAWRTYGGPTDLPCFVNSFGGFKGGLFGSVRMEITEWYPQESGMRSNGSIEWRDIRISPDAAPDFPAERGTSHYYAARQTDAAPLQVGSQKEKFLFYRGVGTFPLPISAKATGDGQILVKNLGADALEGLILFENRGGKLRYQFAGAVQNEIALDSESLQSNWSGLLMDLGRILIEQGLYQREARAMIETWRDSWFEEGTRLFYIVPRRAIDAILPLDIQPAPSQIARVFVGRMEVITPAIREDVKQAIAKNDRSTLEKYGRFLEPIAKRIGAKSALLDSVSAYLSRTSSCSR
ncbi:MAG: hypothetical protein DMG12_20655 [Acidobacteria bacterium]|nr:MAG: hypothetical protein DMG12_20655 [Acidobacteriota bacterium]